MRGIPDIGYLSLVILWYTNKISGLWRNLQNIGSKIGYGVKR